MSSCHGGMEKYGTRVWGAQVLEKVVDHHLFPKQCFVAKKFKKRWYLAILAEEGIETRVSFTLSSLSLNLKFKSCALHATCVYMHEKLSKFNIYCRKEVV